MTSARPRAGSDSARLRAGSDSARPRVGWVSPLPPATSGIADYSAELFPELARGIDLELFHETGAHVDPALAGRFRCRPLSDLDRRAAADLDLVVYQIGNSAPHHAEGYAKALELPGIVVLHETMLHHLVRGLTLARGNSAAYRDEMRYAAGRSGAAAAKRLLDTHFPVDTWSYPLFERLVDRSLGVIVHSRFALERVRASRPLARVARVPMGIDLAAAPPPPAERARLRRELGVAEDELLIASFGFVTPQKRLEPALAAFARLRGGRSGARKMRFAIVGEVSPHYDLDELLARTTREGVTVVGRANAAAFHAWMAAADIAVNLRHPTGGETSATFLRLLALGRPVIVSRAGSFAEVPEGACCPVELDAIEEGAIEAIYRRLGDDPALAAAIGGAARRFVEAEHSLDRSAAGYFDAIAGMRSNPATPLAAVPPLAPFPSSDPWPALLARVGAELADLGLGEEDEETLTAVASHLAELR